MDKPTATTIPHFTQMSSASSVAQFTQLLHCGWSAFTSSARDAAAEEKPFPGSLPRISREAFQVRTAPARADPISAAHLVLQLFLQLSPEATMSIGHLAVLQQKLSERSLQAVEVEVGQKPIYVGFLLTLFRLVYERLGKAEAVEEGEVGKMFAKILCGLVRVGEVEIVSLQKWIKLGARDMEKIRPAEVAHVKAGLVAYVGELLAAEDGQGKEVEFQYRALALLTAVCDGCTEVDADTSKRTLDIW